ncbi:threonine-phosphate decarboxylase CobD [Methanococcoides methylutens]|uniref:threonine-phosphate decarboxylase n=1 Tax=Methanococcoides methylutens MM1 TaxID=1434104 RepID=A0A0E3WYN6_METMT|nr:threonine-phosphate decarboxylase CobD [Methanococcoides methylutens]AKB84339.1 L-threonine 3-O-phosphate decarboxylase [Methanococcoides methylutens MM1]
MNLEDEGNLPLKKHIIGLVPASHGGLVRKASQEYGIEESDIIDMSASLNPYGSPFDHPEYGLDLSSLFEASKPGMYHYPDNRYLLYKEAAAKFLGDGVSAENIIPGNGSCETIRLVAECILSKGDTVGIPQPTFDEYEQQCRIMGANIRYFEHEGLMEISDEALQDIKILFVCNPNNPTGKLLPRDDVLALADRCEANGTLLFVDEAFMELADDPSQSVADVAAANDHVFVLRSLTKNFAIPGIRLGFGVASERMAASLNTARLSWNLGSTPDVVGTALLDMEGGCYSKYLEESRRSIEKERNFLVKRLSDIYGFKPLPSAVNYVLVDISQLLMDSVELTERLASHGILVRDCSSFYLLGNDYVRIAVRNRDETDRLIYAIGTVLSESGKEYGEEKLKHTIECAASGEPASRNTCEYYPCHFNGQDCTFCFCPFYPCEDLRTGGKWIDSTTGSKVWSCEDCTVIHKKDVVQDVLKILMRDSEADDNLKVAWEKVILSNI